MENWKEYILEDVIDVFIDYRGKTPLKSDAGIPLITAKIVKSGRILKPNEFISEEEYGRWMTRGFPEKNDVVLTTEAPLGEVALLKDENIALAQRIITMRGNPELLSNVFLKYYLQSNRGQYELNARASGTTVFGIRAAILKELPIISPPLPEQKAIASVLSSLDDKIDLLHQQNQTLEALAETLFRQWFIEEAKEDWEEKPLLHYFDLLGGFAFKSKEYLDEGKYRVITIKGVQDGFLETSNAARLNELPHKIKPHQILKEGDILISLTGNVGRVCLVDEKNCLLNQRVAKIVPHKESWKPFAYFYFRQREMIERLTHLAKGSAQLNLSPIETLNEIEAFGGDDHIDEFCQHVNSIFKRILKNKKQIRTLTQLRDTLLPKLMSGEVRVEM